MREEREYYHQMTLQHRDEEMRHEILQEEQAITRQSHINRRQDEEHDMAVSEFQELTQSEMSESAEAQTPNPAPERH